MGFLQQDTNNIILDAVLTDEGRKRLAANDGSFRVVMFSLGDDEVDYNIALREWKPLAQQGDADSQNNLRVLFLKRQVVPKNYEIAVVFSRLSAEQGNALTQTYLGGMYGLRQVV